MLLIEALLEHNSKTRHCGRKAITECAELLLSECNSEWLTTEVEAPVLSLFNRLSRMKMSESLKERAKKLLAKITEEKDACVDRGRRKKHGKGGMEGL
eukprot:MONOS_3701.1-p1 / transcript=MONOS_3701.1 / gene=MONOS_3701 / organism=Monocercomonoides_exilis_PA203 / gene_product=unspecified product / transcript_product=unspecified product / location=Mono_scaffold00090:23077-23435(-) / protein_length=98 / sequence_SO=supercontig / SO=protein_coding / is_pseudo=false